MKNLIKGFEKRAKESSYTRDFLGGVDPTGVTTFNAAKGNALEDSKSHGKHRAAATVGGLVGGAAAVAPAISGTMGAITGGLSAKGGWRKRLLAAGKGFATGAQQPFKDVYHGLKGGKLLRKGNVKASRPHMEYFAKKLSPDAKSTSAPSFMFSKAQREEIGKQMTQKGIGGLGALGMSGGISGGSAYLQYGGGRKSGEELRQARIRKNQAKKSMR